QPDLVNLYGCSIDEGSKVGPFVEIQRGAAVGRNCKISSHSFICEGVAIEDGVFIGHGVMFTNDLYPRAINPDGRLQTDADWQVAAVSDARADRRALVRSRYPTVHACEDYREVLNDPGIDAVAIATPVSTHYPLALEALRAGKHVWVEKPITQTSDEAAHLIDEAARRNLVLHVDHTFVYTGAVRKIHDLVSSGSVGRIYYYDSVRVNLGLFQHDV